MEDKDQAELQTYFVRKASLENLKNNVNETGSWNDELEVELRQINHGISLMLFRFRQESELPEAFDVITPVRQPSIINANDGLNLLLRSATSSSSADVGSCSSNSSSSSNYERLITDNRFLKETWNNASLESVTNDMTKTAHNKFKIAAALHAPFITEMR